MRLKNKHFYIRLVFLTGLIIIIGFAITEIAYTKSSSFAPVVIAEGFESIVVKMEAAKPEIMKHQMDLLNGRYGLSNRPAESVTMSGGKPIKEGIHVKLLSGMIWGKLVEMTPEEIHEKGLFPNGFLPLPPPNHSEDDMVFPKMVIDEIKKQGGAETCPVLTSILICLSIFYQNILHLYT